MTAFIFWVAIVNLLLGYVAAVALVEPPLWSGLIDIWRSRRRAKALDDDLPPIEESPAADLLDQADVGHLADLSVAKAVVAGLDEMPDDWVAQLAAEGIVAQTFVEAAAHVLRLEVIRHREQLVTAEIRARAAVEMRDPAALKRLINELRAVNQDWLDKQTAAADMLAQRAGRQGDHEQAAAALEQALLDQAAQIQSACAALESLDVAIEASSGGKKLLDQITSLLTQAHALRDGMLDLLASMLKAGDALAGFAATVQRDAATGLPNRIGLEMLLARWFSSDEQRTRALSAILIDIDRFGRINHRFGVRTGDRTIATVGRLIDETLVKDRGFERLVRLASQSFMLLQGDVGPHQALSTSERLRQSIEATTFDDDGTEFDLTVSCGVIEVKSSESSLELVKRAFDTLRFAKKAGRNRCALDKGDGPAMLDPPQFPVKGRLISLRPPTIAPLPEPPAAAPPAPSAPASAPAAPQEASTSAAG